MKNPQYIRTRFILAMLVLLGALQSFVAHAKLVNYVIHISVDGLRPDAITNLGATNMPNFYRLRTEGAFTDNARTDYDYTETLPNHTTQLTGRGVLGATGHNWTENVDPPDGETLASNKGSYVAGVFDVVHDNGLRTGEYPSKSKFSLHDVSWDAANGAVDGTGPDNGRDKIDIYFLTADTLPLTQTLVANMRTQALHYAFIHWANPDTAGHGHGWDASPGSDYSDAVKDMDILLGVIFDLVTTNSQFAGRTAIILTTDHGGTNTAHAASGTAANYTIPFYVWGPGVTPGASLYTLNPSTRSDPGTSRPSYAASPQPIRNGEAANLALKLLGLPAVPGSTICSAQDLKWSASTNAIPSAPTATAATAVTNCGFTANWNTASGATGYLLDVSTNSAFSNFVTGYQDIVVGNVLSYSVTGLSATKTFYYRVWAYNSNGTSTASGNISATTTTNASAPSTPNAMAATTPTSTSFTANWNTACGATGYRLDVSTTSTFSSYVAGYQDLDVGNVTARLVSSLSSSTTFYYRVRAYNGIGTSGNSGTNNATTDDINSCIPSVLLSHGDMEETETYSVCPDWASYGAGNGSPSWAKETTLIHGGSASQRARNINGGTGSLLGVRQTMDANVGDAFTFSGWVRPVSNPTPQQVGLAARWDGSTANPDGTASWKISGGLKNVWTQIQNLSGNATASSVTLFLDSRRISGSLDITAYWDDVISYRAYVPPAPTVSSAGSTSVNVDVNAGCNTTNTSAQFAISVGGGAYTLGTHWVQTNGAINTTQVWQTDAGWGTKTVTNLAVGTNYTFQEKCRYSGSVTQATSFGGGAVITAGGAAAPTITSQPSAQNVCAGSTATFTVAATGSGTLTYQWRTNGVNLSNGSHYAGGTTATMWVTNVSSSDAVNYSCAVGDTNGTTISSDAALTLKAVTTITQQPVNASVVAGGTTNFTIAATGDGALTYQWQKNSTNLSNGGHYSGCTTVTLTISNADTNDVANYRCVATGGCGNSTSFQGALTITSCFTPTLLNSSFESTTNVNGVATNWFGYQRSPNPTTVWSLQTASPPVGGSTNYQQIANTSSTGGGGVRQDIKNCVIGATYTVAGWMRGNSAAFSTCTVKVSPTASTNWATAVNLSPAATFTGSTWTNFSGTITATGTNMTLWLDGQTTSTGQNKAECFDAITVTCAP